MGRIYISPAKDAKGDPLPLPQWAIDLNRQSAEEEAYRLRSAPADAEEYSGEAESRGLDSRGFNKP